MKRCKTIDDLRERFQAVKSGESGDLGFTPVALLFVAEQIDALGKQLAADRAKAKGERKPRKPSAWQAFAAEGMKAGKSMADVSREWKERKGAGAAVMTTQETEA